MKIYSKSIRDTKYFEILDFISFSQEKVCYIDIETTGFNRGRDTIYLVGLIYNKEGILSLTQYLCEKAEDEYELLFKLNSFLLDFNYLAHFNGDSFDLPFIKERMRLYGLKENVSLLKSFDFYRKLKPLKRILKTDNFKLKTMEAICGYVRLDPYTGGELISLYKKYLGGDYKLETSFITHNEEDMVGLYYLNKLLPLIHLYEGKYSDYYSQAKANLVISKDFACEHWGEHWEVHIPFAYNLSPYTFNVSRGDLSAKLTNDGFFIGSIIESGEKKLFFSDYKDYYYLPEEDTAVHKSVATFMSSKYRKKAKPSTAYIRRFDTFVRIPGKKENILSLIDDIYLFSDNSKDDYTYILVQDFKKHWPQLLPFFVHYLI